MLRMAGGVRPAQAQRKVQDAGAANKFGPGYRELEWTMKLSLNRALWRFVDRRDLCAESRHRHSPSLEPA